MQKTHKSIVLVVVVLVLGCLWRAPAFADSATLDHSKKGSVTLTLSEEKNDTTFIADAVLTLYKVGDINQGGTTLDYTLVPSFKDSNADLFDVRADGLVNFLVHYAQEHKISGMDKRTAADGKAVFDNLSLGLYLVVQNDSQGGYYPIEPFVVSVPMSAADGTGWVYDVDASPKVEAKPSILSPPPASFPSKFSLVQTGRLMWPVPVLAITGVVLFVFGWALVHVKGKSGYEA